MTTRYEIQVACRLLSELGLWRQRYAIASRLTGRQIRHLDELSDEELHDLLRGLRLRRLIP